MDHISFIDKRQADFASTRLFAQRTFGSLARDAAAHLASSLQHATPDAIGK
jgi:hypothetical protein